MNYSARPKLEEIRQLRQRVRVINGSIERNLGSFLHPNKITFTQKPKTEKEINEQDKREDEGKIDASTTSTVLMALSLGDKLSLFYGDKFKKPELSSAVKKLYEAKWTTAGLKDLNFFTAALVFRALGFLVQSDSSLKAAFDSTEHQGQSYMNLVKHFGELDPSQGKVGAKSESRYPLTPTLVYWLLDAADKLEWDLSPDAWMRWTKWASEEFHRQLSYVIALDDASMDPVALAMAACLASKIRRIAETKQMRIPRRDIERALPSREQLKMVLPELFKRQGESGIWPKYFPLFVYPNDALVNHCFAFELMEALLNEFPEELVSAHFAGVSKSLGWCEKYHISRHLHEGDAKEYSGWNSGSNLEVLREGSPECWATAIVHMFLFRLDQVLSRAIEKHLQDKYGALTFGPSKDDEIDWSKLLDIDIKFTDGASKTIKSVLNDEIIAPIKGNRKHRRSALLFGPPGTSKSTLVRELSREIQWPYIEITPSHFLSEGLERIYARANEIFEDLMDLSHVVVLFDEMDALVQRRTTEGKDGHQLDVTRQFLTTSMLPKLAKLYEQKRVLFFMATNHQRDFDDAIKRPGRFDLLLCMGPPPWREKLDKLNQILPEELKPQKDVIAKTLQSLVGKIQDLDKKLDLFTFGDIKAFFGHISRSCNDSSKSFSAYYEAMGEHGFAAMISQWHDNLIVLREKIKGKTSEKNNPVREEYNEDVETSSYQ